MFGSSWDQRILDRGTKCCLRVGGEGELESVNGWKDVFVMCMYIYTQFLSAKGRESFESKISRTANVVLLRSYTSVLVWICRLKLIGSKKFFKVSFLFFSNYVFKSYVVCIHVSAARVVSNQKVWAWFFVRFRFAIVSFWFFSAHFS